MEVGISMKDITVTERKPSVEEYIYLRKSVGWNVLEYNKIKKGLDNSIYSVCIENKGKIIGFGRIVGDGGTVFYIQDIIVIPEFQKKKIGTLIMNKIMDYINKNCINGAIVGLIAKNELDDFYKKFGFTCNQNNLFYRYNGNLL